MIDQNFLSMAVEGKYIYWITERIGFIMRMDTITRTVEYLDVSWESTNVRPYGNALLTIEQGVLYGLCCYGKYLFTYHIKSKSLALNEIGLEGFFAHDFSFVKKISDTIFILPYQSREAYKINVHNGEIQNVILLSSGYNEDVGFFYAGLHNLFRKDIITCFSSVTNERFIWHIANSRIEKTVYPKEISSPVYVQETENGYFMLTKAGNVFFLERDKMECRCVFSYTQTDREENIPFCTICVKKERLWLLPCFGEKIICVNLRDLSVEEFRDYPKDFMYSDLEGWGKYGRAVELNGTTYFAMHTGNYIFCVDEEGEGGFLDVKWPDEGETVRQYLPYANNVITEGDLSITGFIKCVINGDQLCEKI